MRHLISVNDLTADDIRRLFEAASTHKSKIGSGREPLKGYRLATLFYEPSTRTRFSFEAAMLALGGSVISTENAEQFSSAAKGETLEDTIRVTSAYCDIIALRHPDDGSAERAAKFSSVPLVNAGDGKNEHPTQALLDLFTIWEARRSRHLPERPLHLLFWGDNLQSRAVRSLAMLVARHAEALHMPVAEMAFVGSKGLGHPSPEFLASLDTSIPTKLLRKPELSGMDVCYVTRVQKERSSAEHMRAETILNPLTFGVEDARMMPPHAMIMHPLPRVDELSPEVDADPRAWYFKQAANGLYVRMALLEMLLA
jgi:aspartate carbamoyltransferase catalytic subunit